MRELRGELAVVASVPGVAPCAIRGEIQCCINAGYLQQPERAGKRIELVICFGADGSERMAPPISPLAFMAFPRLMAAGTNKGLLAGRQAVLRSFGWF
jgi:hypothetical protein